MPPSRGTERVQQVPHVLRSLRSRRICQRRRDVVIALGVATHRRRELGPAELIGPAHAIGAGNRAVQSAFDVPANDTPGRIRGLSHQHPHGAARFRLAARQRAFGHQCRRLRSWIGCCRDLPHRPGFQRIKHLLAALRNNLARVPPVAGCSGPGCIRCCPGFTPKRCEPVVASRVHGGLACRRGVPVQPLHNLIGQGKVVVRQAGKGLGKLGIAANVRQRPGKGRVLLQPGEVRRVHPLVQKLVVKRLGELVDLLPRGVEPGLSAFL